MVQEKSMDFVSDMLSPWRGRGTASSSGQFKFYSFAKLWGKWANVRHEGAFESAKY